VSSPPGIDGSRALLNLSSGVERHPVEARGRDGDESALRVDLPEPAARVDEVDLAARSHGDTGAGVGEKSPARRSAAKTTIANLVMPRL
jgi:hypothetical protein